MPDFLHKQVFYPITLIDKYYSAGADFWVIAKAQSIYGETIKLVDKWPIFNEKAEITLPSQGHLTATVTQQQHPHFGLICLLDTTEPYGIYAEDMSGPVQFWVSAAQLTRKEI